MKKVIHLIYVNEDGVASLRCGVGMIARQFITAFPYLAKSPEMQNFELRLSIISIRPFKGAIGSRPDFLGDAKKVCSEFKGRVYLIPSLLRSSIDYFNMTDWKRYNEQANAIIQHILRKEGGSAIVIANDSIFAHVSGQGERVTNIWIPNSLATVHRQSYTDTNQREHWERSAIANIRRRKRSYVGVVSPYVERILQKEFFLSTQKLVFFRNSFYIPKHRERFSTLQIVRVLRCRGIPLNKKMIFSFGRADEYKGLDLALLSMKYWVHQHRNYIGVLIASRFSQEEIVNTIQSKLVEILGNDKDRIKLFLGYEFTLPKYLLQYSKTKILLHLPRRDFCPLIPFEAQIFGHRRLCVVNSDLDCFRGLIKNKVNGFLAKPHLRQVMNCLDEIEQMKPKRLKEIISQGRTDAKKRLNIVANYGQGLAKVINE